jgi:pilus assembly protein Flp/PilA
MNSLLNRFVKDESGATAIEYGLLAALIAVAIVATLQLIGPKLNGAYKQVETALPA